MTVRGFRKADGEAGPETFDDQTVTTVDDAAPPARSAPPEQREADAPPPADEKPSWVTARDAIASRFEKTREDLDDDKAFESANDPELAYGRAPVGNTFERDEEPGEAGREDAPPAGRDAGQTHVLKVNGKEVRVTHDQLIGLAQKNLAADAYLAEAKNLRDEAVRALANSPRQDAQQREPSDTGASRPAAAPAATDASDEELAQLVERIQLGDPAEATKALREFVARTSEKDTSDDVEKLKISTRMMRDDELQERIFEEFPKKNVDLYQDPELRASVYRNAVEEMKADIRKHPGVTEENLAELDTPDRVGAVHRYFRVTGHKGFRDPMQITEAAAGRTREWLGKVRGDRGAPQQQSPSHDRLEAKRGLLPQPRRAGAPPTSASPQRGPAQATPQGRSNTVQEMRRARGQSVA